MDAIIRFLQDTGFYLFSQDGNWRCLIMLGIACVLLYQIGRASCRERV